MNRHLVQSSNWSNFKNIYGTISNECDGVFYTLHKIPFLKKYYAYCPKVNPFSINFPKLIEKLKEERVVVINFDRPNISIEDPEVTKAIKLFESFNVVTAFKDTYPPATAILDISKSEKEILSGVAPKHRYNINLATRKNLVITFDLNDQKIEEFYYLLKLTSNKNGFIIKSKKYYETMINYYSNKDLGFLANVYYENEPIVSWMFLIDGENAFYVHGGMNDNYNQLKATNYLVWHSILELKRRGVKNLDLMGACEDLNNTKDPYYGFTIFKIRFGSKHIKFMKSYDLVLEPITYYLFNMAQKLRWVWLGFFNKIKKS